MPGISIGQLAQFVGLPASTLRYYEKIGLLHAPVRHSGQRRYGPEASARLHIIRLARDAGFSLKETRMFLGSPSDSSTPAVRWQSLAERKLVELEALSARLDHMRKILKTSFHCECRRIEDCERMLQRSTAIRSRRPRK